LESTKIGLSHSTPTGEHAARVAGAETYVKQVELLEARDSPNYMLIVYWLEKAIEAYRRIGRLPERVSELQKRLLAMQSRAVSQLAAISSGPVDVKELVEKAVSVVSGKSFYDAVIGLALIAAPRDIVSLRKEVEEQATAFPISHTLNITVVNAVGRTVGRRPPMLTDDPNERKGNTNSDVFSGNFLSEFNSPCLYRTCSSAATAGASG